MSKPKRSRAVPVGPVLTSLLAKISERKATIQGTAEAVDDAPAHGVPDGQREGAFRLVRGVALSGKLSARRQRSKAEERWQGPGGTGE